MSQTIQLARQDERKNKKMILGFAFLALAVIMIVGAGFAFFSDVILGQGEATAGTLDITGTTSVLHNGTTATNNTVANFNPGDVLTLNGTITNNGSKSAWIRQVVQFTSMSNTPNLGGSCSDDQYTTEATCEDNSETWTAASATAAAGKLLDYIWVCSGSVTQADLIAASLAGTLGTATGTTTCEQVAQADVGANGKLYGEKTTYLASADVIDGSAEDDNGTAGSQTTWSTPAGEALTIFFDAAAGNVAQNGNMAFSILTQALQYRNNTTSPNTAAWSTVTATEFAL